MTHPNIVTAAANAQSTYNPAYFEAAFYELRKFCGGWPYVSAHALRCMYNAGAEL